MLHLSRKMLADLRLFKKGEWRSVPILSRRIFAALILGILAIVVSTMIEDVRRISEIDVLYELQTIPLPSMSALTYREESAAVCVIVQNDEAYLDEWVDYHHALGFAHFYVYDHSESGTEMKQWGQEKGNHVTVLPFHNRTYTKVAYADCTKRFGTRHTWLAYFKVEEFLILKNNEEHSNVISFLRTYCYHGALTMNLVLFGAGGRRIYSPLPVTKRFVYHEPVDRDFSRVKFMVRSEDALRTYSSSSNKAIMDLNQLSENQAPLDVAVIHHYLRSMKEYKVKMGRPVRTWDGSAIVPDQHEFELVNGTVFDDSAWTKLKQLVPKYRVYDEDLTGKGPRYLPMKTQDTACICAVVKDEEAYIDEWLDYHHALGFSHFYIYDNSLEFEMEQWAKEKGSHVTVIHDPGEAIQSKSYLDCSQRFATNEKHTWAAFIDVDEMIILQNHLNIVDMLYEHCQSGALSLNWVIFGPGKREVYQPLPFTKRFKYRDEKVNEHVKSIARIRDIDPWKPMHPHHPFLRFRLFQKSQQHDVNGNVIVNERFYNFNTPSNTAFIHHYSTKSYKEYIAKRMRGRSDVLSDIDLLIQQAKDRYTVDTPNYTETGWEATKQFLPGYRYFDLFS